MKLNSLFTERIRRPEGRKFLGSQPTHDEFLSQKKLDKLERPFWEYPPQ